MPTEATILVADIADSAGAVERLGAERAAEAEAVVLGLIEEWTRRCRGQPLKRTGDAVECTFDDADAAATAAVYLHREIGATTLERDLIAEAQLSIGLDHGELERTGDTCLGECLIVASRLTKEAKAGQTYLTREVMERLPERWKPQIRPYRRMLLRGLGRPREIFEILLPPKTSSPTTTRITWGGEWAAGDVQEVEIRYGRERITVGEANPVLEIGRDQKCGLAVRGDSVSRFHARVSWDVDQVVIRDRSTNGLFVEMEGGQPVFLHGQSTLLAGRGTLHLGSKGKGYGAVLQYACRQVPRG